MNADTRRLEEPDRRIREDFISVYPHLSAVASVLDILEASLSDE
jgi:hypothetical protein